MGIKALARQALASGNIESAEKLVGEALRQDPNDPEAAGLKGALGDVTARRLQTAAEAFDLRSMIVSA